MFDVEVAHCAAGEYGTSEERHVGPLEVTLLSLGFGGVLLFLDMVVMVVVVCAGGHVIDAAREVRHVFLLIVDGRIEVRQAVLPTVVVVIFIPIILVMSFVIDIVVVVILIIDAEDEVASAAAMQIVTTTAIFFFLGQ